MTKHQNFYAKLAGISYVTFTIAGLTKMFLNLKLTSIDMLETNGLFQDEMQFRFGIFLEIILFLAVILASTSFYAVTKSINKQLSQTALCLRLVELIVGGMAVVFGITMLAIANKSYFPELLDIEQMRIVLIVVSNFINPAYEYSWIFMGFAGIITFYLLSQARYIPKFLGVWGVITYSSLIIYPIAKLLIPNLPREVMFVMFPGALFELTVGIWLMIKGINIPIKTS
ncbi:DUF4386 domain-containing protein [Thalassotalea crassostreae]|uniref:DUF4386 domain-containing protein n=1 Tax=Thalassotalea crassostreae TaxID=1763536 RepID=UPI0008384B43|nr:DUF4386 domain-containing protein [Thalassotalea crassostreae]